MRQSLRRLLDYRFERMLFAHGTPILATGSQPARASYSIKAADSTQIAWFETKPTNRGAFGRFLQLIRFSHTIFALPFAFGALLVAANGRPSLRTLLARSRLHGLRAHRRDAFQSAGRLVARPAQSAHGRSPSPGQQDRLASVLLVVGSSAAFILPRRHQPNHRPPFALRAGDHFFLLAHKTFHQRQSFFSRPRARGRSSRRLDRANRPARFAAADSRCRRHLLGGGFRSHLRHAGFRVRSARRLALVSRDDSGSRKACASRNGCIS